MDHSKKNTYLFSIDALRVLAILAVILIHTTTNTLAALKLNVELTPLSLFLNQASRFAVPLFFLISGFVLELNNKEGLSYIGFFKKRAARIVAPFIFWSSLYFLFGHNFNFTELLSTKFLWSVLVGSASYHLYFIPTLILFYLAFPFLHSIIRILKHPLSISIIVLLQGILLYRDYYIQTWSISQDLRIALLSFSMFIAGMVASHYKESLLIIAKKYLGIIAFSTLGIVIFIFFHVYEMTIRLTTSRFIYNQYGPLNYIYTGLLALLLYYILEKTQFARKLFISLSKLSFFVFFIHVLILNLTWKMIVDPFIKSSGTIILQNVWFDLLLFTSIAGISFGIAYIIHLIPSASKITG